MNATRRERRHIATREEIKAIAREHMAAAPAAALSLRAIASQMGLSAAALYYYYPSRDDLITDLIADAYNDFAATLEAAGATCAPADALGQLVAVGLAYRQWALSHPAEYALIFGNPIPGYHAPVEVTTPIARRGLMTLIAPFAQLWQQGALADQFVADLPPQAYDDDVPPAALHLALRFWVFGHGMVSLELFGHLQQLLPNPADFFHGEVLAFLRQLGLTPPA